MGNAFAMRMYRSNDLLSGRPSARTWNPLDDIPWEKINKDASDDLVLCAETFCGRDDLPDTWPAASTWCENVRQEWFQANWAYEESKHALAPHEYLMRSGKRPRRSRLVDFQTKIFRQGGEATLRDAKADGRSMASSGDGTFFTY